jgi:hypothetical protein
VKPLLNSIMGGGGLSALAGLFGGGSTGSSVGYGIPSGVPMASGTNRVPYDGFKAILHKDEAVVPAKYNPAAGGGETSVTIINNTGAGVREERSESGGKKMVRIIIGEVARDMARGGSTRQAAREAIGPRQRRG